MFGNPDIEGCQVSQLLQNCQCTHLAPGGAIWGSASEVAFVAQPVKCRTWQPGHRIILFLFFLIRKGYMRRDQTSRVGSF